MIGRRPRKEVVAKVLGTLNAPQQELDRERALKLWNDFRWRIKIMDGDYSTVAEVLKEFIQLAAVEIKDNLIREEVCKRFGEMLTRLSEFDVKEDTNEE